MAFIKAVLSFDELMALEQLAAATTLLPICVRLMAFMDFRRWNAIIFVDLTELDVSTYSRIKNNRLKKSDLRTIVAIAVGLLLPIHIVESLLDSAGLTFGRTKQGLAYRYVLLEMRGCTIYEANLFLSRLGVPLLGSLGISDKHESA